MHATSQLLKRALWKGPFFVEFPPHIKGEATVTMARNSTILPSHVGRTFNVHTGNAYKPVTITEKMISRKLGEFAPSKKPFSYKKKEQKKKR